eukprot:2723351-Lingulodinium_polyedra.AAC.1
MHVGAAAILKGARVLLLRELIAEAGWGDTALAADLAAGLPIVGGIPVSGVFPEVDRPASATVKELWRTAPARRARLLASVRPAGAALDQALLDGTKAEFEAGAMRGPYTVDEALRRWGNTWLPARRFC